MSGLSPSEFLSRFALPDFPHDVVGLTISADQLAIIRARRKAARGMSQTDYGSPQSVGGELNWSRALFRERGSPVLDVTDRAVEETAARVIDLVGLRGQQVSSMAEVLPD